MTKYAAMTGNHHAAFRVTTFFNTANEAAAVAPRDAWVVGFANWQEHVTWNAQRVGMYATHPVANEAGR